MSDLLAMAVACDQTRAFSVLFTGGVGSAVFRQVGAKIAQHQLTHDEPGDQPLVHAAIAFTMTQLAYLSSALAAIPEGAGNVLDAPLPAPRRRPRARGVRTRRGVRHRVLFGDRRLTRVSPLPPAIRPC